ncbi:hypothetical protein BC567DRAFT_216949 [Phyllosticta citribraziliensis]
MEKQLPRRRGPRRQPHHRTQQRAARRRQRMPPGRAHPRPQRAEISPRRRRLDEPQLRGVRPPAQDPHLPRAPELPAAISVVQQRHCQHHARTPPAGVGARRVRAARV